jgi:hypothetical protein
VVACKGSSFYPRLKHTTDNAPTQANFLLSVRAAVNLVLLLVVLPALNFFLMEKWNTKLSSEAKDLLIARGSILLMAFGFVGIAMAPTAAPMVLGNLPRLFYYYPILKVV